MSDHDIFGSYQKGERATQMPEIDREGLAKEKYIEEVYGEDIRSYEKELNYLNEMLGFHKKKLFTSRSLMAIGTIFTPVVQYILLPVLMDKFNDGFQINDAFAVGVYAIMSAAYPGGFFLGYKWAKKSRDEIKRKKMEIEAVENEFNDFKKTIEEDVKNGEHLR